MPPVVNELRPGAPDGRRMVLVHGVEDAWQSWCAFAAGLDPSWQVYALDLPWRSRNDYRWRRGGGVGHWLAEAMTQLDGTIDAVVGHSLGGNAVLDLLSQRPPRIRAGAVLCPVYQRSADDLTWEFLDRAMETFHWELREGARLRLLDRPKPLNPEIIDSMMRKLLDRISPVSFFAVFDQFLETEYLALHRIEVPLMVVSVGNDPGLSADGAKALAERIPQSVTYSRDDFDHFCHVREAPTLAREVGDFIRHALD